MGGKSLTNSSMLFPLQPIYTGIAHDSPVLRWMDGILHHQKDGCNPINNGINHLSTAAGFRNHPHPSNPIDNGINHLSTGAGFRNHPHPSTVCLITR